MCMKIMIERYTSSRLTTREVENLYVLSSIQTGLQNMQRIPLRTL